MSDTIVGSDAELLAHLHALLDQWVEQNKKQYPGSDDLTESMAHTARQYLEYFLRDNSSLTAVELEDIARKLSPGTHNSGQLADLIYRSVPQADALLLAAVMRWNWHNGKVGFQFLPDPAMEDIDEYWDQAELLIDLLQTATDGDPLRILTGEDRAFYESLPDTLTVYRGCSGISSDVAKAGLCWTTKRDIADWFARRCRSEPVVVMASISKRQIAFVKASEHEIVVQPTIAREIKYRKHKEGWRPEMQWTPPACAVEAPARPRRPYSASARRSRR